MEVLITAWMAIASLLAMLLVALSAPLVILATVCGCRVAYEELEDRADNQPSPRGWLKRKLWQWFTLIIFVGFVLLNGTFLLYYYFPWNGGLWGVFS